MILFIYTFEKLIKQKIKFINRASGGNFFFYYLFGNMKKKDTQLHNEARSSRNFRSFGLKCPRDLNLGNQKTILRSSNFQIIRRTDHLDRTSRHTPSTQREMHNQQLQKKAILSLQISNHQP